MVAVQVSGDPSFAAGQQEVLFSTAHYLNGLGHQQYDVSADDQRFVMIRIAGGGTSYGLVLVLNWFEELKAKVGN